MMSNCQEGTGSRGERRKRIRFGAATLTLACTVASFSLSGCGRGTQGPTVEQKANRVASTGTGTGLTPAKGYRPPGPEGC